MQNSSFWMQISSFWMQNSSFWISNNSHLAREVEDHLELPLIKLRKNRPFLFERAKQRGFRQRAPDLPLVLEVDLLPAVTKIIIFKGIIIIFYWRIIISIFLKTHIFFTRSGSAIVTPSTSVAKWSFKQSANCSKIRHFWYKIHHIWYKIHHF